MIQFVKYEAAGNDFIVVEQPVEAVAFLCHRKKGIGADGLIWIDGDHVHFFNQDGSMASCCGNGLRIAFFHTKKNFLHTLLGVHSSIISDDGCCITYPDPRAFHEVVVTADPTSFFHPPREKNINYVKVLDRSNVLMKTIERGVGETASCGSGAISTFLHLQEMDTIDQKLSVQFVSGEKLLVRMEDKQVWLEGPVKRVFTGQL